MNMTDYRNGLGEHGKDTKLNLSNLFGNVETSGMTATQFYGTALALAYSIGDSDLIAAVQAEADGKIEANVDAAAKLAATLMAMNNIRSEEHTSELQSRPHLVCRLLLE